MAEPYQQAMNTLIGLGAERVLVVQGPLPMQLLAAHGLNPQQNWTEQVSLGILEQSLSDGSPLLLGDAQSSSFEDRWSVAATEIRSVLCVPFWSPSSRIAGLLYADVRSKAGIFTATALSTAQRCARQLEKTLYGVHKEEDTRPSPTPLAPTAPTPPAQKSKLSLGLRPARIEPARPDQKAAKVEPAAPGGSVDARTASIFYRSLATMVGAGLPIARGLDILSQHGDSATMRHVAEGLSARVQSGSYLSGAMSYYLSIFSRCDCQLVQMAEKSGKLNSILQELATYREKLHETQLRLRSALTYPVLMLFFCLTLLLLGPPYLLQGQFQLIRESGQTPPFLTRIVMVIADFLSTGGFPLLLLLSLGGAYLARQWQRSPACREFGWRMAMRVNGLSQILTKVATARFARSLGLTYRVGIPMQQCLQLATHSTENPLLVEALPRMLGELENGSSLLVCLGSGEFFPPAFLHMVAAGEESGKVDDMMDWVARLYDGEVECALESLLSMLEPILMLGMGILVGLLLVATLLPMIGVLQSL